MAQKAMQIRYYGEGNENNYPKKITQAQLKSGKAFADYLPFSYLKITGPEVLKFYLNNGIHNIQLFNGKFELDLNGVSEITNLAFDNTSFKDEDGNPVITDETIPLIIDIISNY